MKLFLNICEMTQNEVKIYVRSELKRLGYETVFAEDGFVFAPGEIPVLLCAHMDTVHACIPHQIHVNLNKKSQTVISAEEGIGGDDRCGIYMVLQIAAKRKCSVLFLEDEEIGLVGAGKFTEHPLSWDLNYQYIMEFDRANRNDAVFYECDNPDFVSFIEKDGFYKEAFGSCSDISEIAPHIGCAAVNLSCGYYNQHTKTEYVIWEEMLSSVESAIRILDRTTPDDCFAYVPAMYQNHFYDDYDDGETYIIWFDDKSKLSEYKCAAWSYEEAIGRFMIDNPGVTYNEIIDVFDGSERGRYRALVSEMDIVPAKF